MVSNYIRPVLRSFRGSLGLPVRPALDVPHVSRVQMVEIDRSTMEDFGISLIQMMENAGALLADLTRRSLGGSVEGSRITVLAGRGHNGGGGLVAARRLHLMGAHLDVLLAAEPDQYSGVPGLQTQIITNLGMTPRIYQGEPLADSDIVLDALIGYGLEGAVLGMSAGIIHAANSADRPVISLDLPSGLDADSGDAPGEAIRASATLTLALPKTGFLNPASQKWTGKLFLADISVPQATYRQLDSENVTIFGRGPLVRLTQNFKGTQA